MTFALSQPTVIRGVVTTSTCRAPLACRFSDARTRCDERASVVHRSASSVLELSQPVPVDERGRQYANRIENKITPVEAAAEYEVSRKG